MRFLHFVGSAALIGLLSSPVHAATVTYVESTDGMISTDNLNPTDMGTFGIGISSISGSVSNALSAARTSDNFTFQLDPGTQLESIIIRDAVVPSNIAFVGMAEGPTFPYLSIGFGTINNDYLGIGALTFDDGDTVLFDSNTGENDFGALAAAQGGMGVIAPVLGPGRVHDVRSRVQCGTSHVHDGVFGHGDSRALFVWGAGVGGFRDRDASSSNGLTLFFIISAVAIN